MDDSTISTKRARACAGGRLCVGLSPVELCVDDPRAGGSGALTRRTMILVNAVINFPPLQGGQSSSLRGEAGSCRADRVTVPINRTTALAHFSPLFLQSLHLSSCPSHKQLATRAGEGASFIGLYLTSASAAFLYVLSEWQSGSMMCFVTPWLMANTCCCKWAWTHLTQIQQRRWTYWEIYKIYIYIL